MAIGAEGGGQKGACWRSVPACIKNGWLRLLNTRLHSSFSCRSIVWLRSERNHQRLQPRTFTDIANRLTPSAGLDLKLFIIINLDCTPQASPASFQKLLNLLDMIWAHNECRHQIIWAPASAIR